MGGKEGYYQNTALTHLGCGENQLTSLDLSNHTALTYLRCYDNQLISLNVKNGYNSNIYYFVCANNPLLYCIDVDNVAWSNATWIAGTNHRDSHTYFSENCP